MAPAAAPSSSRPVDDAGASKPVAGPVRIRASRPAPAVRPGGGPFGAGEAAGVRRAARARSPRSAPSFPPAPIALRSPMSNSRSSAVARAPSRGSSKGTSSRPSGGWRPDAFSARGRGRPGERAAGPGSASTERDGVDLGVLSRSDREGVFAPFSPARPFARVRRGRPGDMNRSHHSKRRPCARAIAIVIAPTTTARPTIAIRGRSSSMSGMSSRRHLERLSHVYRHQP